MLHDLEDKANEETGHDGLNQESFTNKLAAIVAAESWAKLSDVVRSRHWEHLLFLWEPDHGCGAESAAHESSNELEEHHDLSIDEAEGKVIMSMLDHHTQGNSWVKVTATDGAEHLGHDCDGEANANWRVR